MSKTWKIWTVVTVAVVGLIILLSYLGGGQSTVSFTITAEDHVRGSSQPQVVLLEFGDFQCVACSAYHPLLKQIVGEFGDRLAMVYRHFPLNQIHPNADLAARASEAAGRQGRFWEMHDLLLERQTEWSDSQQARAIFMQYATNLRLNIDQFNRDLDDSTLRQQVADNYSEGFRSGVNSTPTFFLNGEKINNPRSLEEFKNAINQALKQ